MLCDAGCTPSSRYALNRARPARRRVSSPSMISTTRGVRARQGGRSGARLMMMSTFADGVTPELNRTGLSDEEPLPGSASWGTKLPSLNVQSIASNAFSSAGSVCHTSTVWEARYAFSASLQASFRRPEGDCPSRTKKPPRPCQVPVGLAPDAAGGDEPSPLEPAEADV